ncbi:hypothetical protein FNH13_07860 [Ornithinimicrobium ciconiae]|uniref:Uncharacterized protein n=1 Tax=Ornithinimicrobium ciconiae TaxID=2594265 RepID=A0A516G9U7_9MICO|nr:hypothetical protein [Ornithinimicrobium ciconiae]QDO88272.1 hypothetical protein FNH13_07860 [Ornithinimicrobium ciconiae]
MDEARTPWAAAQRRAFVRGGLAAAVATTIALLFHLMAGGAMPALPGLVIPLLLAISVCILLAGVRLPSLRLLLSVGASQLLFHNLFMLGATDADAAEAHAHHATGAAATQTGTSVWMVVAHLAAALLTAAALRHGELILARLSSAVRHLAWRFLHPVTTLPVRPTTPAARLVDEQAWVPTIHLAVHTSLVRRGPPIPLAVPTP